MSKGKTTRIIDARFLLRELERLENGGKKMRRRSTLKTITFAGLCSLLAGYLITGRANKKIEEHRGEARRAYTALEHYKDNSVPYSQIGKIKQLRDILNDQIKDVNSFFIRVDQAEQKFKGFVDIAKDYMKKSTPQGELEETAKQQVDSINQFLDSYSRSQEEISTHVQGCYKVSTEISEQANQGSMSGYRSRVAQLNDSYSAACNRLEQKLTQEIEALTKLKEHTKMYPLKGRSAMIRRIEYETKRKKEVLESVMHHKTVFNENSESNEIFPVKIPERESTKDMAMGRNYATK